MNLVDRAKNMILTPKTEWEVVNTETSTTSDIYKSYVIPLAAIGPIASFIGMSFIGMGFGFMGGGLFSITGNLIAAIVSYVFALVGVFLLGLLINVLAPSFGATPDPMKAFKVAAYSYTPAWIAGILHIVPLLGVLGVLAACYGIYVLYLGLPILMKAPQDKAPVYTIVIVVCAFVLALIFGAVSAVFTGFGMFGHHSGFSFSGSDDGSSKPFNVTVDSSRQVTNTPQAQINAAANALQGGGTAVDTVDQSLLKALMPEALGNLKRNKIEAEKVTMGNFKISKAEAGYADDQGSSINLTVTDAGGTALFGALAAWSLIEQDSETSDGYEKMGKIDGRPTHQKYNTKDMNGEFTVIVANRFVVEARGQKVDMDALKQAVVAVGPDKLEAMKGVGVK